MTAAPPSLTYARARPPWYRRRGPRRAMFGCLIAATIAGVCWAWNSTPGEWARFNYWEWRCEHYSAPPDQVVFDPPAANSYSDWKLTGMPLNCPQWWKFEAQLLPLTVHASPPTSSVAFLQDRQSPSGKNRLVAVELRPQCDEQDYLSRIFRPMVYVNVNVVTPTRGLPAPTRGEHDSWGNLGPIEGKLKVFAGQPDPSDRTHFTIAYRLNDVPGIMDFHLQDDDTVAMKILSGPLPILYQLRPDR
jgi:hypothetical protein